MKTSINNLRVDGMGAVVYTYDGNIIHTSIDTFYDFLKDLDKLERRL